MHPMAFIRSRKVVNDKFRANPFSNLCMVSGLGKAVVNLGSCQNEEAGGRRTQLGAKADARLGPVRM